MCFSATASFTVAAGLVPVGVYAVAIARKRDPSWLALAAYPLLFATQQAAEGLLWLSLDGNDPAAVNAAARVFLFFSHIFWLTWVPLSVFAIENTPWRRHTLGALTVLGGAFGLSIGLPSILFADWLDVEVIRHSIQYKTTLIYDGWVGRSALRAVYVSIIVAALMLTSDRRIRYFGFTIIASLLFTFAFFAYAYISVWCFFAALLSVYLALIVRSIEHQDPSANAELRNT